MTGCASDVPVDITKDITPVLVFSQMHENIPRYIGRQVRYGGTLIKVNNRDSITELEILSLPLGGNGLPDIHAKSLGRFIAQVDGFIDPESIKKDSRVTVSGVLIGEQKQKIDEYLYKYPVIKVNNWYSWGIYQEPRYIRDPFYDPFFYNRYRYPYMRPPVAVPLPAKVK
jgi:outer membrane lipoprotein